MIELNKFKKNNLFFISLIFLIGVSLRLYISQYGSNFDYSMWKMNLELFKNNESFYNAGRYNYGPIWIHVLVFLDNININFLNLADPFRVKIIFFLSLVDFFIFLILLNKYNYNVSLLFFFNPVSIFITGFHNQFDNFSILIGLLAIVIYKNNIFDFEKKKSFIFLVLIGVSLIVKHILFFLPIWLAISQKKLRLKFFTLLIPYSIFLISFLPYLKDLDGIVQNVFLYKSYNNGPIWNLITPRALLMYVDKMYLFVLSLFVLGFILKKKILIEKYFLYLLSVVIFSSGIFNQYLAIPLVAIAYFWNRYFLIFTILSLLLFLVDKDALALDLVNFDWSLRSTRIAYHPILLFLFLGFLNLVIGKKFNNFFIKKIKQIFKSLVLQFR